jgi:hypothetical protein
MLVEDNSDFYYLSKTPHLKNLEREKPTPPQNLRKKKFALAPYP